ncbi:MAG: glycosyltransferase [Promethearchaeota archaeon]
MDIISQIQRFIEFSINFIKSINFLITVGIILIIYQVILLFIRDKKYIHAMKEDRDPDTIKIEDLNELPLINIIIPAWKEGSSFRDCLLSITKLKYPNLKTIINAGGSEETTGIASSFENQESFIIFEQKGGGKMKALNECLEYVNEGIVYSIDADVILTDEILLRLICPIINQNEHVTCGGVKPFRIQQNKSIVKYVLLQRIYYFKNKFSRYGRHQISGPNTCFNYEVIESIEKFPDDNLYLQSDRFRGPLILSKGYKIYWLNHPNSLVRTDFPDTPKKYFKQETRWRKNQLLDPMEEKRGITFLKFIILILYSLIIVSTPIFLVIYNFYFMSIGLILFLNIYLIKIRRFVFFKSIMSKDDYQKFGFLFFIKVIFYIYLDMIMTLYLVPASLISFSKRKIK